MLGICLVLLIIDGEVNIVEVGVIVKGVRLVVLQDGQVVVDVGGWCQILILGVVFVWFIVLGFVVLCQILLFVGFGGYYIIMGMINGQVMSFFVDIGVISVFISQIEVEKFGLCYFYGKCVVMQMVNGIVLVYLIDFVSVCIGDVEVCDVDVIVIFVQMSYVLFGNSFLNCFQMWCENDVMILELCY